MITPEEFPYIKSLYVNNCYTYRNFPIELNDYKPFSHLILTGKNGSGKSTILRAIHRQFFLDVNTLHNFSVQGEIYTKDRVKVSKPITSHNEVIPQVVISFSILHEIMEADRRDRLMNPREVFDLYKYRQKVYSYFSAKRIINVAKVETPSKEEEFTEKLNASDSTEFFISKFKQYLVNRKVEQAFSQIDNQVEQVKSVNLFFDALKQSLNKLFEGTLNSIDFDHKSYEFYLHLTDSRRLTFDTLSEGFSALISILMDLFMRVDLIRKQVNDYSYNPCGIVLIDEPETHLHLQLQEQVLPLLTNLFPNIQFIAATHSPAVIASIKQATIFDLTTKESRISEETAGRSYSDLMRGHFGMNNEYSAIADELFRQVDQILKEYKHKPDALKTKLQQFFIENEAYFSPSFRVELESMILENA